MIAVFDFLMSIYQSTLFIYALKKQCSQKVHSPLWEVGCVSLTVLFLTLIQYTSLPIPDSVMFLFPFIFIKLTSDEKVLTCLFWVVLDAFLFMGTLAMISSVFDIQIEVNGGVLSASEETMIIYSFVGNTAITVVLIIASRISNIKNMITQKEVLLFFLMLLLTFIISECFFSLRLSGAHQSSLLIGSACAFIVLLLTIVLYEHMLESARKQKQAEISARTFQLSAEHQDELKGIYKKMLAEQHDLRHRIAAAEEILAGSVVPEEQRRQALSMLQENPSHRFFLTGSIAADAILTAKFAIMENAGIAFDFTEYPLTILPLPEQDFCVLLSNLLDNAIEGVMNLPANASSRAIRLSFSKVWDMLFISCSNDADLSQIAKKGDVFLSTKKEANLHGFGIENMRHIVKNAGGTIEFALTNNRFSVEIMLGGNNKEC